MPNPRASATTTTPTPAVDSFRRRLAFCFSGEAGSAAEGACRVAAGSALCAEAGSLPCSVFSWCSVMAGPRHALSPREIPSRRSFHWHEHRGALVLDQEHQELGRLAGACV